MGPDEATVTAPFATGTYALLRGNTTDGYGDDQDTAAVVTGYGAIVGAVVEAEQVVTDRASGMPRTIRTHTGRFPARVPFSNDDRLKDNATGDIYVITRAVKVANPITGPTARLSLTLVT